MLVPFRLVDVFCERPLQGNQLCVVPDPVPIDDVAMQALAKEIGFSETTFVSEAGGDRYAMRIFTPDAELPFAGHPTLGTAFVMVSEGRVTTPLIQVVAAGEIPVEVDVEHGFARMRQLPPTFGDHVEDVSSVAAAIGLSPGELHPELRPQAVSTGLSHLVIPVRDLDTLRRAERNTDAARSLVRDLSVDGLYPFALTSDGATARMFDVDFGVGEDPATGSAAGPLGAYLAAHAAGGMPGSIRIRQGEQVGRPSLLEVDVLPEGDSWRVFVGGGVAVVGRG
ncbi:MAG TPA: PhzF family phenazine biosynthesis protein, partial [Actinomycetota bacterium]